MKCWLAKQTKSLLRGLGSDPTEIKPFRVICLILPNRILCQSSKVTGDQTISLVCDGSAMVTRHVRNCVTSTLMERGRYEFPNHGHFELPEILDANGSTKVEGKLGLNNGIREGARVDALTILYPHVPMPESHLICSWPCK